MATLASASKLGCHPGRRHPATIQASKLLHYSSNYYFYAFDDMVSLAFTFALYYKGDLVF